MGKKITVAITGASGSIYAQLLLRALAEHREQVQELAIVWSSNAQDVWRHELEAEPPDFSPFRTYQNDDYFSPIASGSAAYDVMIICPCSMGTLARVANGASDSLITRAGDVMLKERKKLICVLRETPYSRVHLHNMQLAAEAGVILCPATPSFYSRPKTINALAMTVINRVLQLAGIQTNTYKWGDEL